MKNRLNEILYSVAEQIFESLAFLLLAPEEDAPIPDGARGVTASIMFDGAFEGTLFLCVSEEMLPAIATNMLGLMDDETLPAPQQRDAFKELLNVVCGNFLPQVVGETTKKTIRELAIKIFIRDCEFIPRRMMLIEGNE